jgi:hypothetical protein
MPGLAEDVSRPLVSANANGAYQGDEAIAQNDPTGQTLNLSLFKSANLAVAACSSAPAYTVQANEALNLTITKTATLITVHFALDVNATVSVTKSDGSTIPFATTLDISGDLTVNPATGCYSACHISYCGKGYDTSFHQTQPHGAINITDADTAFSFNTTGADGLADLIIANNQATQPFTFAEAPDPHTAAIGAGAGALSGFALEAAFPPHGGDPVSGVDGDDAQVLLAMGQAALAMIANPGSQAVAVAAVLHATAEGAELAVDDGLAAYGVLAHPPPGAVLLG